MEVERRELRRCGGAASFYASPSSVARYLSNAGLSCKSSHIGCEDLELEHCCQRLCKIADRFELAHSQMLDEHDRRALAKAIRDPYACFIPIYPKLRPQNGLLKHTAQIAPCTRSPQMGTPKYYEAPGEKGEVQTNLNPGPCQRPWVPSVLRSEEVMPHVELRSFPEPSNGSRSPCHPIEPVKAMCPTGPVRDVPTDNRPAHDPILQNQFTGYNMMFPPQVMHEPSTPSVVPVPVPVRTIFKKIESSAHKNKKRKKEYGDEVIQIKPTTSWPKWPCRWCSVNFHSKEAIDAHLQEQHQGCKGDGPSESEKYEKNRCEEARNGLTVISDGCQITISEASEPHSTKKIRLDLPPSNRNQKLDELNEEEFVPILERKEIVGSNTSEKIKFVVPPLNLKRKSDKPNKEEVVATSENEEITGSPTNKKIKLDLPLSNLTKKPEEVTRKEVLQTPDSKEIADSNIIGKMNLDMPSSSSKQKPDEQSKEDIVPTPENKETPGISNNKMIQLDFPPSNQEQKPVKPNEFLLTPENKETAGSCIETTIPTAHKKPTTGLMEAGLVGPEGGWFCGLCRINTLTKATLDEHFDSNDHQEKMNGLLNGPQKSKPADRTATEKPVLGESQATSVSKLEDPKEETSKSVTMAKPVQGPAQAVSAPELVKPKEETSKTVPMTQKDKMIEATTQDKGNSSFRTSPAILRGHKNTAQQTAEFSDKNKYVLVNGATKSVLAMQDGQWFCNFCKTKQMSENVKEHHINSKKHKENLQEKPILVMQDGKWFCNLCQTKQMSENVKEDHIQSKRHKQNLQSQAVSCRPEHAKPVLVMRNGKWFCNFCETKPMCKRTKENHVKCKRHKQNLKAQSVSCRPEPAKLVLVMKDGKWYCNLCQTKQMTERIKEEHIKGKKHKQNLGAQPVPCRPEPAKPRARLHRCFICNIVCTTEDELIAHFNEQTHREALRKCVIGTLN